MTTQQQLPDEFFELEQLLQSTPSGGGIRPEKDRRSRRRAVIATIVGLAVLIGVPTGYVGWALTAPVPAVKVASSTPAAPFAPKAALALPEEGASVVSVSGGDVYLGKAASGVWAKSGTNEPRSIGSITKLITALVILDARPLHSTTDQGPTIVFTKADRALKDKYYTRDATIAEMPAGTAMSEHDALAVMLLPSASNYAEALANWAFGSQSGYRAAVRRWLAAHKLTHTTIVEPTGISRENRSTPTDLLKIGRIAAANEPLAQITAMPSISVPGPGTVYNTNDLLGRYGVTGLKTGNLGPGTYNLLYSATFGIATGQKLTVTGVLLGGDSRESVDADVTALLGSIQSGFHEMSTATHGDQVGTCSTPWGSSARLVMATDASVFTWSDTPITVQMTTSTSTTCRAGEVVGKITWAAGPNSASSDIVIDGSITEPTAEWRLTHPFELGK